MMINLNKLGLILITGLITPQAANSMGSAARFAKKHWKTVVAAGTGILGGFSYTQRLFDKGTMDILDLPDLDAEKTAQIKQLLVNKGPQNLDQKNIDKMRIKKLPLSMHSASAAAFGGFDAEHFGFLASDESQDCDHVLLHELGHLYYGHSAENKKMEAVLGTVQLYAFTSYLLKGQGKKRFLLAPIGGVLSGIPYNMAKNTKNYQDELQADCFAIDCLKKHKDIAALKKGRNYYLKHLSVGEEQTLNQLGVPSGKYWALPKPLRLASRMLIDCHPETADRVAKIDEAIRELESETKK